jgi:hypothetical protein
MLSTSIDEIQKRWAENKIPIGGFFPTLKFIKYINF